nr:uncharacterized protein LOC116424050 [Nomia melanderi]
MKRRTACFIGQDAAESWLDNKRIARVSRVSTMHDETQRPVTSYRIVLESLKASWLTASVHLSLRSSSNATTRRSSVARGGDPCTPRCRRRFDNVPPRGRTLEEGKTPENEPASSMPLPASPRPVDRPENSSAIVSPSHRSLIQIVIHNFASFNDVGSERGENCAATPVVIVRVKLSTTFIAIFRYQRTAVGNSPARNHRSIFTAKTRPR